MCASRWVVSIRTRPCFRIRPCRIGNPCFSSVTSRSVSVVVAYTSFEMCGLSEPSGGGAAGGDNEAVITKSVSAPWMLSAPLVSNHTPNPPLLPPPSPPHPIFAPRYPSDAQLAPPSPPWWIIHASSNDSPGSSQTRSQGRTMKSPVIAA